MVFTLPLKDLTPPKSLKRGFRILTESEYLSLISAVGSINANYSAASNWSASVESPNAVVEDSPPAEASEIRSK